MQDNANKGLTKMIELVKNGRPFYVKPYEQPKVWGVNGIGEYWYGAESGEKSSLAVSGETECKMDVLLETVPEELLGKNVIAAFGKMLPLVKVLTPKGRLSVQFHDAKNELWIVTGLDRSATDKIPSIIVGFSSESVDKYGKEVTEHYGKALLFYGKTLNDLIGAIEDSGNKGLLEEKKDVIKAAEVVMDKEDTVSELYKALKAADKEVGFFYNYREVNVGDVIPVPAGTLHALGPGVEIVEPQIPGPTQSLEDGANYPVRYYFPGFERPGAQKALDTGRVTEMHPEVVKEEAPELIDKLEGKYIFERLPGNFEDKGLEVHRIILENEVIIKKQDIESFHTLTLVKGKASVKTKSGIYEVPKAGAGGEMLFIPAATGDYEIVSEGQTEIIDTFTPV